MVQLPAIARENLKAAKDKVRLKKKLTLKACVENDGLVTPDEGRCFEVMINPESYDQDFQIIYNEKKTLGQPHPTPKFSAVGSGQLELKICIDGTGAVDLPLSSSGMSNAPGSSSKAKEKELDNYVKDRIDALTSIVYEYDGTEHRPSIVQATWGPMMFYGCLDSMKAKYVLFKPNGNPLRAEISLRFKRYVSSKESTKRAKKSSPDLLHVVEVKDGDSLPLLCHRIYKDSSYYPQVAKVNGLVGFRELKPGLKLYFPP